MASHATPLRRSVVVGFGVGALGTGVYSTVPTVLLLFYCTEILRFSPSTAAIIVFVPKAWAILWDPMVGIWSDRCRTRIGRRAPFILVGAVGVTLTFALLFNAPAATASTTVVYVMSVYFAMATAYSVYAVPYVAVPAEISPLASERERLMAWRMGFGLLGVMLGAGVAPHLVALAGGGRHGYGIMAIVVAIACGLAMLTTFFVLRSIGVGDHNPVAEDEWHTTGLRQVLRNPNYVCLWIVYLVSMSGVAMLIAMAPYYVTHVLMRNEGDTGTVMLALLAGTVVSLPAWRFAMQRWGGWSSLFVAMVAYAFIAGFIATGGISRTFVLTLAEFLALGLPFAGLQLIPFTLLAHIAHDSAAGGVRAEGLYAGLWTAGEKLALAVGPSAAGAGLAAVGYTSGSDHQTVATVSGIQAVMAMGPALFLLPAALGLALFRRGKTR